MSKMRCIGAVAAAVAIIAALGMGLWFGGGPSSREGWEAASWSAGITTALSLVANVIVWAFTSTRASSRPGYSGTPVHTNNTVHGNVSGGTVIQGHEVHVAGSSYEGSHNDFRGGTFHGSFVNEQHHHLPPHEVDWPVRIGVIPEEAAQYQHRVIAEKLEQALDGFGTVVLRQVLSGTGGVGKTQLAAHHARSLNSITDPDRRVDVLVWANAATRTGITSAYGHAARQLFSTVPDDTEEAAAFFLSWLADPNKHQGRRWLIVWDDLADPSVVTDLWPPHDQPHGRSLVTTRRRDHSLTTQGRHLIEVDVYTAGEARSFLIGALDEAGIDHTDGDLNNLADALGRLPLALGQAVPYMAELGMDCEEYLQVFHDRMSTLHEVFPDWSTDTPLASTWDLSLTMADAFTPQGLARPLMGLIALLDGNGVPEQVFTAPPVLEHLARQRDERSGASGIDPGSLSPQQVRAALAGLRRLNLITRTTRPDNQGEGTEEESVLVGAHQLVQRATREHITTRPTARDVQVLADALVEAWSKVALDTTLPAQRLRAGTAALRSHPVVQGRSSEAWLWESGGYAVLFRAGTSLGESGHVKDALTYWQDMYRAAEHHKGRKRLATLIARKNLAAWQGQAGDPEGAVTTLEQLLPDCVRVLGRKHRLTLATRHNLANWRGRAGDPRAAFVALRKLLRHQKRVLGSDHLTVFDTRRDIAHWQGEAGDLRGAYIAQEELLADCIRVLGSDHSETLATRFSIAGLLDKSGDLEGAITVLVRLLPDCIHVLGPDHRGSFATRSSLASWMGRTGDPEQATETLEQLLADEQRVLGSDHPSVFDTRQNIAHWQGEAGDPEGAVVAYEELLADRVRVLGVDHPDALITRAIIAYWRHKAGDLAGAILLSEELLADRVRVLGADHIDTLTTRIMLAHRRHEAGDPETAVTMLQEVLPGCVRALGPDHPTVFNTRRNIAHWQGEDRDLAGTIAVYEELFADAIRVMGAGHPFVLGVGIGLFGRRAKFAQDKLLDDLTSRLNDKKQKLGSDHPEVQDSEKFLRDLRALRDKGLED
ncbi:tetratricopeptide repeat protein [Nocardiopsis alba]|uniref:tetratricopeptide repeat protein n=1 Tax=Nocardiopsis alba TaxID=53437 RepID=UPI00340ED0E6